MYGRTTFATFFTRCVKYLTVEKSMTEHRNYLLCNTLQKEYCNYRTVCMTPRATIVTTRTTIVTPIRHSFAA
jgi:hypothetical protein